MPAIEAPFARAIFASSESAPKRHARDVDGDVELDRLLGEAGAEHRLRLALLAVALDHEAGQGAREEDELVPVRDRLEDREAAHPVAAELGLDVDVVDDLGREDAAPPEDVLRARAILGHERPPRRGRRQPSASDHQLLLGRLERVVVVEDLAADELLELRRRAEPVDVELAVDELRVGVRPLAGDAVDPERLDLAGDVDRRRRTSSRRGPGPTSPQMIWRPRCIMKPFIEPASPADDDRAALLVDPRAGADAALDHEVAAAQRRARERAGVAVDDHDAAHHVLARRPADAALDVHLGPVDEPAREVAEAALERDLAPGQDPDAERVPRRPGSGPRPP